MQSWHTGRTYMGSRVSCYQESDFGPNVAETKRTEIEYFSCLKTIFSNIAQIFVIVQQHGELFCKLLFNFESVENSINFRFIFPLSKILRKIAHTEYQLFNPFNVIQQIVTGL